jgi:glycosyltransferase involved in cell wall biosynthesis
MPVRASCPFPFYHMPPPSSAATNTVPFTLFPSPGQRSLRGGSPTPVERSLTLPAAASEDPATLPLICFCHLSWNWVWQRPQQFMSRLAKTHPVLFVETYCSDVPTAEGRVRETAQPNVTVFETHLPSHRWHDGEFIDRERRRVLQEVLQRELRGQFQDPILWFYDPMAVRAFAGHCREQLIAYDCMDELSQFKGAPAALVERERELLALADVVFCGGRKMRDKRLPLNANCHFYGTGVDVDHFGAALSEDQPVDPDIAALPGPVLGYFGVVDERIDYDLLAKLADARSDWSIAMVGPVAKVDPASFPRRPNLHWLGGRPYERLPAITKGFSVCLMPFALNAATEYINPTKALEYMAAGRPVVSTALAEVRSNFSDVCQVARSHDGFIGYCHKESTTPSQRRVERGLRLARRNTWEAIAARMEQHLQEALATRRRALEPTTLPALFPFSRQRAAYV